MNENRRTEQAGELIEIAVVELVESAHSPDPVQRRRLDVRAAKHLRAAADILDDHGRLTE